MDIRKVPFPREHIRHSELVVTDPAALIAGLMGIVTVLPGLAFAGRAYGRMVITIFLTFVAGQSFYATLRDDGRWFFTIVATTCAVLSLWNLRDWRRTSRG